MRHLLATSLFMLSLAVLPARAADTDPDPWAYFGLFTLDDGTAFHGGLLQEGAADLWIFGDPDNPGIGGVYRKASDTTFLSLLKPGQTLAFSEYADGEYQQIALVGPDDHQRSGRRTQKVSRHDVQIPAAEGAIGASLLMPQCAGPHPLIVFVNGSGRTTRHIGGLGTYLLSQGLALLVYDKRDGDPGTPGWQEQSLVDIGKDAAAALVWATAQPDVDASRAGIFGSSQGGWTGPMASVAKVGADFMIIRAGPGVSEAETNLYEVRGELRAKGLSGRDLDKAIDLRRALYDMAVRGETIEAADALVAPWVDTSWYRTAFGARPISELWSKRWWNWVSANMAVSPIPYLERFEGPVLWFLGAEDENVPLVSSHAALSGAFARMPGDDQTLVVLPDAPHSFVIDMQSPDAHYAEAYYPTMREWLATHGLSRPECMAYDKR